MDVYVFIDEYVFDTLKKDLFWAVKDEDKNEITKLTALLNKYEKLDDTFLKIESIDEFGELIDKFKNQGLKVNINYNSHSKEFHLDVEFA